MPVSILVVAMTLLVSGLGGLLMGLSLIPTDMGRAWLDMGTVLFTGGMVALAIGFATATLARTLRVEPLAATRPAPEPAPLMPDAALGTGTIAAAGGAILGAGLIAARKPALAVEDPEQDLFADMQTLQAHQGAEPEASLAGNQLAGGDDVSPAGHDMPALPPLDLRLEPLIDEADAVAARVPEARDAAPPPPAQAPVAGLIADEDLAALANDEVPLAPFDTLEIVGAYDSGGVRFTMYSDGSVNAVSPAGERRYRSLEALRAQLDSGEPAV